jgi:hypothetical protein
MGSENPAGKILPAGTVRLQIKNTEHKAAIRVG